MRVGLLADIHGNHLALKSVLTSAKGLGVTQLMICGDFVGYYYGVESVLEQLSGWSYDAIGGNHEDMLRSYLSGVRQQEIVRKYGTAIRGVAESLKESEIQFLLSLPSVKELSFNGKEVMLCHGSPWDRDEYVYPDTEEETLDKLFEEKFDLMVLGHTHYPTIWTRDTKTIVNPGSVGQPRDRKPGACWALWDLEEGVVEFKREAYDCSQLIRECKRRDPDLPYLVNVLVRE